MYKTRIYHLWQNININFNKVGVTTLYYNTTTHCKIFATSPDAWIQVCEFLESILFLIIIINCLHLHNS